MSSIVVVGTTLQYAVLNKRLAIGFDLLINHTLLVTSRYQEDLVMLWRVSKSAIGGVVDSYSTVRCPGCTVSGMVFSSLLIPFGVQGAILL